MFQQRSNPHGKCDPPAVFGKVTDGEKHLTSLAPSVPFLSNRKSNLYQANQRHYNPPQSHHVNTRMWQKKKGNTRARTGDDFSTR